MEKWCPGKLAAFIVPVVKESTSARLLKSAAMEGSYQKERAASTSLVVMVGRTVYPLRRAAMVRSCQSILAVYIDLGAVESITTGTHINAAMGNWRLGWNRSAATGRCSPRRHAAHRGLAVDLVGQKSITTHPNRSAATEGWCPRLHAAHGGFVGVVGLVVNTRNPHHNAEVI